MSTAQAPWSKGRLSRTMMAASALSSKRIEPALHEPYPLIPSFSPTGGEGARRAVEGDCERFMAPTHVQSLEVFALPEPRSRRRESAHSFLFEAKDQRRLTSAATTVLLRRTGRPTWLGLMKPLLLDVAVPFVNQFEYNAG